MLLQLVAASQISIRARLFENIRPIAMAHQGDSDIKMLLNRWRILQMDLGKVLKRCSKLEAGAAETTAREEEDERGKLEEAEDKSINVSKSRNVQDRTSKTHLHRGTFGQVR